MTELQVISLIGEGTCVFIALGVLILGGLILRLMVKTPPTKVETPDPEEFSE